MSEHWAVIPVKGLRDSKTRLAPYLGDSRKTVVEALLQDVLSSVLQSKVFDKTIVISPDENVANLARSGTVAFLQQTSVGLNRAVDQVRRLALKEGVLSMTTILADIPLAEPRDFAEIFHLRGAGASVVLAPSLKMGTNVMLASPPSVIRPRYGRWSYSKHLREAQVAGVDAYSASNPRVSFDIDTPHDLLRLRRKDPENRTRTARILLGIRPLLHHPKAP